MNIGDYVRTKNGISKIISNSNANKFNIDIFKKDGITLRCIRQKDIIKSSPNIIDLIEVGDYVNGSKVLDIAQAPKKAIYTEQENGGALLPILNNRIESVLSKEQFESMEYKVKE